MAQESHTGGIAHNCFIALRRKVFYSLCGIALLCAALAHADNTVIEIQYGDAREIAETLEGLVESGGSIRVYRNQLIIQAGPENTAELKSIIEVLDETPRKLLISVKSPGQTVTRNGVFKVSGHGNQYRSNGNGNTYTTRNPDGTITQTTVRLSSYSRGVSTSGGSAAAQSVQALEGHDAYIQLANASPGGQLSASRQGFYVNARIHGQQVVVSLHTNNDRVSDGELETAGIDTRVRGQLGKWFAVGSLSGGGQQSNKSLNSMAWNNRSSASVVYVKVDLLQ